MPITSAQKAAIEEVITRITSMHSSERRKYQLAGMFLELVDRKDWSEYYEIIPEPRCLNHIRSGVEKNRYKDALDVYTDLSLVFWNALFYNEPDSTIAKDAATLKATLESEWKKRPVLPLPRSFSPPPSSAQKVHKMAVDSPPSNPAPPAPTRAEATRKAVASETHKSPPAPPTPAAIEGLDSSEMEVDVEGMQDDMDVQGGDSEAGPDTGRNPGDDEIIRQLEKGLPKWPGASDKGWMHEDRYSEVVHAIKTYKDVIGNRLALALENIPDDAAVENLSYTAPLSLKLIESRARHKNYASSKEFDMDMTKLFEKARRWHEPTSEPYGRTLLLQRLYHALTSAKPPPGPPYSSTSNFAFMAAGPSSSKSGGEGANFSSLRMLAKAKTAVDELHYKGWSVKLGDWVHISNPDDPARPIPGQVFKCWTSTDPARLGEPGITVAWYFRPEQTFHPASRTFFENEVFKSSHFGDHPLEDIIERIGVQFTARHIRGRPRSPHWYPGWPLYVCDSRYHDQERTFVRIKNWNSCIPEILRKNADYMPIYELERVVYPPRISSPFVVKSGKGAVKGPGGIIDGNNTVEADVSTLGRKRTRRGGQEIGTPTQRASPALPAYDPATGPSSSVVPGYEYQTSQLSHHLIPVVKRPDRTITSAIGSIAGHQVQSEELPPETARYFDRDPETNEVLWFAAPPLDIAIPPAPKHSMEYLHFLAKRKKALADENSATPSKAKRTKTVPPTVTETMREVYMDVMHS
ncbi:hypothetical protein PC9H_004278 [Pleurotus ostreatus]|uniref:Uncharacterized protein n=1 Tax=Pleurotus ostreatus TaxID=5322 RepID=A0A8H7A2E5_PLEOS|nr:uncharacterized protein PC9H_004278 [Pleurotus ostreatus]KAF7437439.1 hypothetical protein PC9H_004278 [Pleurotus ostreatus]